MTIKQVPAHSSNYGKGRSGKKINKIVLHWIVGTLESADTTFKNPDRKASAHYGVGDNEIHQYVQEEDTAWHASNLTVNRESIGIEHEGGWLLPNKSRAKPTETTHQTSGKLVREIADRYNIPLDKDHIVPHNKYSNTQCPGSLDIDKIIEIAKGGDSDMDNKELDQCRVDRDTNWNLLNKVMGAIGTELDADKKNESVESAVKAIAQFKKTADDVRAIKNELTTTKEAYEKRISTLNGLLTEKQELIDRLQSTPNENIDLLKEQIKAKDNQIKGMAKQIQELEAGQTNEGCIEQLVHWIKGLWK